LIAELILAPNTGDSARAGAQHVARALTAVGVKVLEQISVCKGKRDFQKAVAGALKRSNVVITLGGLDVESGGLAKQAVASGLGLPLETNKECYRAIENYCERTGESFLPGDGALAQLPKGSLPLPGKYGKTPGILISSKFQHIVMLPEHENEALSILSDMVIPHIKGKTAQARLTRTLRTYGLSEEAVRWKVAELMTGHNPAVTVCTEGGEVLVQVSAQGAQPEEAATICTPVLRRAVDLLGESAYGLDVQSLQAAVVGKLRDKDLGLALAEAGTNGELTRLISEVPESSDVLRYSVFVDDNAAKKSRLGIPSSLLKKYGPVSEQAAVQIAGAARKKSGAPIAVSLLVGDDNEGAGMAGLVYIAVCAEDNVYVKKLVIGSGSPEEHSLVLETALSRALNMIRLFVDYYPKWHMAAIPLEEALEGRCVTDLASYDDVSDDPTGKTRLSKGGRVKKAVLVAAMFLLVACASYFGYQHWETLRAVALSAQPQDMFIRGDNENDAVPLTTLPGGYSFAYLHAQNSDIVAFINIPGTTVSYPVVQASDNDFYLRRNFNGESCDHGVPFVDFRVNMHEQSDNTVVYGHNMQDGLKFGGLLYFNRFDPEHGEDALDFFVENHIIEFTTLFGETEQFKIFSVFIANASPDHGPVFEYHSFIEAESEADFVHFVDELETRSLFITGVDVQPGDKLLTLSTCTYEFDDARFVVVARRLREGEIPTLNRSLVELNPEPLMPDIWHHTFGDVPTGGLYLYSGVIAPASTRALPAAGLALLSFSHQTNPPLTEEIYQLPVATAGYSGLAVVSVQIDTTPPPQPDPVPAPQPPPEPESEPDPEPEPEDDPEPEPPPPPPSPPAQPPTNQQPPPSQNRPGSTYSGTLRVRAGGGEVTASALEIVSRITQIEVGPGFHPEAIRAQAVAAYSFVRYFNDQGQAASVLLAPTADPRVESLVAEVLGQAVYFNGQVAFTPYHATSAGRTNSSRDVWGGHYPYLIPVDSSVDRGVAGFERRQYFTITQILTRLETQLNIIPATHPETWFQTISYTDGGYIRYISINGNTTNQRTGARITGRMLRESVFNLRSASFTVEFDRASDQFVFTTFGHGHGVGMSQTGANVLAQQGWSYVDILTHYFPGTTVR